MNRTCIICEAVNAKYKCPKCFVYYCSVACCNKHKIDECEEVKKNDLPKEIKSEEDIKLMPNHTGLYPTNDTVEPNKLCSLANNSEVKDILTNTHLRTLLCSVNESTDAETAMANAMQEPIFMEFANACLKLLENN